MSEWIKPNDKPIDVFNQWYSQALKETSFEPTKMTLATVDESGMPSARVVLLKSVDEKGFSFFTNYDSRKGNDLKNNGKAAIVFHWEKPLHRQVRIRGLVEKLSYEESNQYFQTRQRGSQIGAWASPQSQEIQGREELEKRVLKIEERFNGQSIPCPENWGGYVIKPLGIEFWQAQDFRLHDRILFFRDDLSQPWKSKRLAP